MNGVEITPKNYDQIGLVLNYGNDTDVLEVSTDSITLVNEAVEMYLNHISPNGVGATEGIPYQLVTNSTPPQTLEYFISPVEPHLIKLDAGEIDCKIVKRWSNDSFFAQADPLTFTLMRSKGVIFPTIDVPYVIVKDNQVEQGVTLSLTVYAMEQALAQAIKDTSFLIAEFVSAIGVDVSDAVAAGMKLAFQIIYTIAIIIALIKIAQQVRELLLPKIRFLKACSKRDLIRKGVEHLGYTLQSSLLDGMANEYILPVPIIKEKESILDFIENDLNFAFNYGYPTGQDTTPTLGRLIREVMSTCNARTTIVNGVVRIERRDHIFDLHTGFQPALVLQGERSDAYQLNTNEIYKRAYTHYQTDPIDWHTMNEFERTDTEWSTEQMIINNPDLVMIQGYRDVPINFALGSRKSKLNWVENLLLELFASFDAVASVLGVELNMTQLITNRIGVLQIGTQFFQVSKTLYLIGGKQPTNYLNFIGALAIQNKYHNIDFIGNNAFEVRELSTSIIDSNDFVNLQNSNVAEIDGLTCELTRVEFYDEMSKAIVTYKKPSNWAHNLKHVMING